MIQINIFPEPMVQYQRNMNTGNIADDTSLFKKNYIPNPLNIRFTQLTTTIVWNPGLD